MVSIISYTWCVVCHHWVKVFAVSVVLECVLLCDFFKTVVKEDMWSCHLFLFELWLLSAVDVNIERVELTFLACVSECFNDLDFAIPTALNCAISNSTIKPSHRESLVKSLDVKSVQAFELGALLKHLTKPRTRTLFWITYPWSELTNLLWRITRLLQHWLLVVAILIILIKIRIIHTRQTSIHFQCNGFDNGRMMGWNSLVLQPIPKLLTMFHGFDFVFVRVWTFEHEKLCCST